MSIAINPNNMVFTPMMTNDVMSTIKSKTIKFTDKAILKTLYKLLEIARDENKESSQSLELVVDDLTIRQIQEMNITKWFNLLNETKDKLYILLEQFENSKEPYGVLLYDLLDETLDYVTKNINIILYLQSII